MNKQHQQIIVVYLHHRKNVHMKIFHMSVGTNFFILYLIIFILIDSSDCSTFANFANINQFFFNIISPIIIRNETKKISYFNEYKSNKFIKVIFDNIIRKIFIIYCRQHQALRQGTVADNEWLDLIRFIVYKPLENELQILLDKYKMVEISFEKKNFHSLIRLILIVSILRIQLMQLFVLFYVIWSLRYYIYLQFKQKKIFQECQ
jgi:hypothetical protein